MSDALNLFGLMYYYEGNYKLAIQSFQKSILVAKKLPDEEEAFTSLVSLSETYLLLGKFDLAEEKIRFFLDKAVKLNLNKAKRKAYGILAKIYLQTNQIEKAILYFNKALKLAYINGDKLGLSTAYNNIAIAFFETNEIEKAKINFHKALQLRLEMNIPKNSCESYYNLAEYYFYLEDYPKAMDFLNKSLTLAKNNNLNLELVDAYFKLMEINKKMGNDKKALEISILLIEAQKKQLFKLNENEGFIDENFKYAENQEQKLIQKQRENQLLIRLKKEKNNFYYLLIFFTILTCFLFFYKFKNRNSG